MENINLNKNTKKKAFLDYSEGGKERLKNSIREKQRLGINFTKEESDFWEADKAFFDNDDQPYHYHGKHH